ncbi:MAG: cellulase family glycosylhydrolase [Patescibacteria group bacterium]
MFWFLIILVLIFGLFKIPRYYPRQIDLVAKDDFWGLTYSPKFASELGLDWQKTYIDILDELEVKNLRIPIYWDQIEKTDGEYDFSKYDYIFDEGKKRNVNFIANIGWRLPRWPECHAPAWVDQSNLSTTKAKTITMLGKVVEHFKDREEIVVWQVENEPLLDWFGECPKGDKEFLQNEIDYVRSIDDSREIIISASGELSSWKQEVKMSDIFGTTMYRVVWNPIFKYIRYPLPAWYYRFKAWYYDLNPDKVIVSELQTEPWVPKGTLADLDFNDFDKSFSIDQFKANMQFAINVDFKQTYLWGVEWWYLQKQSGHPEYWDLAKSVFKNAK